MHILLADDHAIVRTGLRRILTDAFPDAHIGEVASVNELTREIEKQPWKLLILDIGMGSQNSLEVLPQIKKTNPDLAVIILSMYHERPFIIHAFRSGAMAYLVKDRAPEELLKAIGTVLKGKRYVDETIAIQLAEHISLSDESNRALHEKLSPREYDVFLQLAQARSVTDISKKMSLSVKTVSTYRNRILEKMGMHSNAEIIRYALQNGLTQ